MIELNFMVDPDELKERAFVRNKARIRFKDTSHPLVCSWLGESGLKLADAGMTFIINIELVAELVANKIEFDSDDVNVLDEQTKVGEEK